MRRWLCCTCQVEESYPSNENEHLKSPRNYGDGEFLNLIHSVVLSRYCLLIEKEIKVNYKGYKKKKNQLILRLLNSNFCFQKCLQFISLSHSLEHLASILFFIHIFIVINSALWCRKVWVAMGFK